MYAIRSYYVGSEECKLGKLLRDRTSALCRTARDIGPSRTRHPARIDTPMIVEPPVLDRQESLHDMRRQLGDFDRSLYLGATACDRRPVGCQQRDLRRRNRLQRFGQRRSDRQPGNA